VKVTFKVTRGHGISAILQATYDFLSVFHCNYGSILYRFRDSISYSPSYKTSCDPEHTPFRGSLWRALVPVNISLHTKFKMPQSCLWNGCRPISKTWLGPKI